MVDTTFPPVVFTEGQVTADEFQIRYREAGTGDPVIILQGISWGFRQLEETLARHYRVIVLELPGFGRSPANQRTQSVPELAGTAARAVAQLVVGGYTLIGTSFSANVALWQALQTPDLVEALVLISPTSIHPVEAAFAGSPGQQASQLLAHPEGGPDSPLLDESVWDQERSLVLRLGGNRHDATAEARLGEVACPTLVVFGSKDRMVAPQAGSTYRANIPVCNVSLVYDTGHLIVAERSEALLNAVSDYVANRETFIVGRGSSMINP